MMKLDFEEKTTVQLEKHIKSMEHKNMDEKEFNKEILANMENDIDELEDELAEKDAYIEELGKDNCQLVALVKD